MRLFFIPFLATIIGFCSCNQKPSNNPSTQPSANKPDLKFFQEQNLSWKYDSQGNMQMSSEMMLFCMNWKSDTIDYSFRKKHIQPFSQTNFFNGMKKNDLTFLMGYDEIKHSLENEIIRFNMESGCKNSKYDCCRFELYIGKNNTVSFTSVVCS